MLRKSLGLASRVKAKRFHSLPDLQLDKTKGIPGLFSPRGLEIAWFEYQQHVLDNLNELIKQREGYSGSEFQHPSNVMIAALQDSTSDDVARQIAKWASLAYANEFFFRSLGPENRNPEAVIGSTAESANKLEIGLGGDFEQRVATIPQPQARSHDLGDDGLSRGFSAGSFTESDPVNRFYSNLNNSFDSQQAFRELVLSRGSAMFGNGALWMIEYADRYSIVNTYNWGTPHSSKSLEKSAQNQNIDLNTDNHQIPTFKPLLAINVWQHAYIHDYGVAGKRDYLRNVFDTINWDMIISRAVVV